MPYLFSANGALLKSAWGNAQASNEGRAVALNRRY